METFELSYTGWALAWFCSMIIGMSKCGMPGLASLAVPMMAAILPAKTATGALLPILIFGDLLGALYFRRHANVRILIRMLPIAMCGIFLGYLLLGCEWVDDQFIRISTGIIVVIMVVMNCFKKHFNAVVEDAEDSPVRLWTMAIFFGLAAGLTTMLANAAGPVVMLYLLTIKLPKEEFIGTSSWYFTILNWIKVPFMINRGMITMESCHFNLKLAPIVLVGAGLGIIISKRISNEKFRTYIQVLTVLAAIFIILPKGFLTNLIAASFGN